MAIDLIHRPSGISRARIVKIGLALIQDGCLLTARKVGGARLILPGGKPEADETDEETLHREIREELSCDLVADSICWLGTFEDEAADALETSVLVRLYGGLLDGVPRPTHEIVELCWFDPNVDDRDRLAPSLRNQILSALFPEVLRQAGS